MPDEAGRTRQVTNFDDVPSAQTSFSYTYDNVGNRTGVVEASGDRVTWTYDQTYQLLSEYCSGIHGYRTTGTYDDAGNRETEDDGTALTTYTYDAANRLQQTDDGVDSQH